MIFKEGTLRVMRTVVHKAFAAKVVALKAVAAKSWLNVASVFGARNIRVASLAGLAVFGGVALSAAHLFATEDIHSSGANDKTQTKVQAGQQPKASQQTKPGGETVIAKLDQAEVGSASRHLATMLAPVLPKKPMQDEEPNLAGLSEIPPELIWNLSTNDKKEAKPKAFAEFSKGREQLPWDAVEPIPFAPLKATPVAARTDGTKPTALQPVRLPNSGDVGGWLKAKVTEIKGTSRSRPLYHFELWLEPPAAMKQRLVGVAYDFSTPAIRPQSQASSDRTSGFRISAGGLACADEIKMTLRFDDGSVHKVAVDGCKLLS
jgi:hypothetical protein